MGKRNKARSLGIPEDDPEAVVEIISRGKMRKIDLGAGVDAEQVQGRNGAGEAAA